MVDFADFLVTSPDDRVQLAVEAKRYAGADPTWAAALRRNLLAHTPSPQARFFLLALPDRFYLWKDAPGDEPVPPQYTIDARSELAPYTAALHTDLAELSGEGFELLVQAWLGDLLAAGPDISGERAPAGDARRSWLFDSGLWDAIRTGRLRTPVARNG